MGTLDRQLELWAAQKQRRLGYGEDLALPREVEHFAFFRRKAAAEAVAGELSAHGFTTEITRRWFRSALCATRADDLSDESVTSGMALVIDSVEGHGGEYDGWGAPVVAR